MIMRKPDRAARQRKLGELLLMQGPEPEQIEPSEVDISLQEHGLLEFSAGGPVDGTPEFRIHECWRMLLVYPDDVEPTKPGRIDCMGCGAAFRVESEYVP